jgi:predicted Fe-Mo cluster-binding NifX family protein
MDAQHAAGLRAAQMLVAMGVDVVLGNNVGFEPFRVFDQARIEVYTDVQGTAWQALGDYPDNLTRLTVENVPAHFGITGSKSAIACKTFDTQANAGRIVQGKYFICFNCQYRISENNAGGVMPKRCPRCGALMHEVVAVAAPLQVDNIKPQIKVL